MPERPCLNCGAPASGLYCPDCVGVARTAMQRKRVVARDARIEDGASDAATGSRGVSGLAIRKARRGVANFTEARFRDTVLAAKLARGELVRVEFEPLTLHIHGVGKYTPDFVGVLPDNRLWCWEVKGPQRMNDGAVIRLRAHAAARPWIRFTMVQRSGGTFKTIHDLNAPGSAPLTDNEV